MREAAPAIYESLVPDRLGPLGAYIYIITSARPKDVVYSSRRREPLKYIRADVYTGVIISTYTLYGSVPGDRPAAENVLNIPRATEYTKLPKNPERLW